MGFRGANRGQSEVIGAILIFAIIVTLIGINQAFIVPDANADVEFQHNNDVQRDMVDLRSGSIEAAASNRPRARTIALGTDYPTRFLAVNPPSPTGTFRTTDGGTISSDADALNLSNTCLGSSGDVTTKFLEYRPNYNEYQNARPITVENTVIYRSSGGNNPTYNEDEQIFIQDNEINIIRYTGDFGRTASDTASINLIPSQTGIQRIEETDGFNITVPTQLDQEEWEGIANQTDDRITNVSGTGDGVTFRLDDIDSTDRPYLVRCTTIGINQVPNVEDLPKEQDDPGDNVTESVNPVGTIRLDNATTTSGTSRDVTMAFDNQLSQNVTITEARINFYSADGQGQGNMARTRPESANWDGTTLFVTGDPQEVNETLVPGTNQIELEFNPSDTNVREGDWFVLTLVFEDETVSSGLYFVPPVQLNGN